MQYRYPDYYMKKITLMFINQSPYCRDILVYYLTLGNPRDTQKKYQDVKQKWLIYIERLKRDKKTLKD